MVSTNIEKYGKTNFAEKVAGMIPAGGSGFRSTPMWTRMDPYLDTIAKPAMNDLFWRRPYLDLIFDYLLLGGVVKKIFLSIGEKPKESIKACKNERDIIVLKAYEDMKALAEQRDDSVIIYFDNPGQDKGTGASVVSEEGKELLRKDKKIEYILVCFGDVPTIPAEELKRVVLAHLEGGKKFTLISSIKGDPFNYGRIVRYPKTVLGITTNSKQSINPNHQQLTQKIRQGELIMIELAEVDTKVYGEWAKYIFLEREEYKNLQGGVTLYHPQRKCLKNGSISLTKKEIEKRRVRLKENETIIWDPQTDDFYDVKEQGDIGKTSQERMEKNSLKVEGIEYPLSTDYLHSIKERNTGLVVMNKEVFLKTVRDIDFANCEEGDVYALARHGDGEYYLPEIAKELKKKGDKIELYNLGEGMGEGYDFRTDTREGAVIENEQFIKKLRKRNIEVKPGTKFWLGGGFDYRNVESGVIFEGKIVLQGDIRIKSGVFLKDTEVWNYFYKEYDSEERKKAIRENRRGLDFLSIGENSRIEESLIVNLNIGKEAEIRYSEIVGVDTEEKEKIENKIVRIGENGEIVRILRGPRPHLPSYVHLERLEPEEFKVLEHVYAVSIRPGSEIYSDRRIREYLRVLARIVEQFGGAKPFCKKYIKELKRKRVKGIPGLEKFADANLNFYLGANTVLNGKVGFEGKVYIDGWSIIYNSLIKESKIGRNARISYSLIEKSSIESSPKAVTIVDNENIRSKEVTRKVSGVKSSSQNSC